MKRLVYLFVVLSWTLFFSRLALPQVTTATISGAVRDETGAVLPGVSITIKNLDTGVTRTVLSDEQGRYHAPNLALGNYEVQAELAGFQTEVRRGIKLTVGRQAMVDITLKVGEITEQVLVTAEAPLVDTTGATVSGLVGEREMVDLPLNGRSFDQLITLQAGTVTFRHAAVSTTGSATKFSVGGQRWLSNKFYQDGVELTGSSRQADMPGSAAGLNLGVDAIREFRVLTNNYSAEYGKRVGGAITTVTKSGTNEFHGTLFLFHRNDNLDARNFFDRGDQPEFKRNNFGGSLGGPIVRNKTFFFFNYEGLRERLGLTQIAVVPDENARRGFLPDATGRLREVGVAPSVRPYLNWWPAPNGRNFGDGSAEAFSAFPQKTREDFLLTRIDHNFSNSDSLFGSYAHDKADSNRREAAPTFAEVLGSRNQVLAIEEKHIFSPSLLNVARFGFSRAFSLRDIVPTIDIDPSLQFVPGAGFGNLQLTGTLGGGRANITTPGGGDLIWIVTNLFQFTEQLFYTRGRHAFQFGAQVQRLQRNSDMTDRKRGTMLFGSLEDFLAGVPRQFSGSVPPGTRGQVVGVELNPNPVMGYRQTYFALYGQDQLRVSPNLTVDFGLRYEFMTVPGETNGKNSNFLIERVTSEARFLRTTPVVGGPWWDQQRVVAPRLGLAWDPFSKGRTSVRAGVGVFYEQNDSDFRFYNDINPPHVLRAQIERPQFPRPFGPTVDASRVTPDVRGVDPNIDIPTVLHYNLGIQQELKGDLVLRAAYVGSHGYHILSGPPANLAVAQILSDGRKFWPANAPVANPALAAGQGLYLMSNANSFYNSFQLELDKRFSDQGLFRGLRYKAALTVAKSIDDASGNQSTTVQNSQARPLDPLNIKRDRGLSAFDVRRTFVLNFTYEPPTVAAGALAARVLNGWQLNGIVTISDGNPVSVLAGPNVSRNRNSASDRPDLAPGADSNPVLGGPNQYFDANVFLFPQAGFLGNLGRNTVIGPGLSNLDFSLVKTTRIPRISEDFNLQFRAEFFNVLNRPNFGVPLRELFDTAGRRLGSAGRITSTVTTARQIQFGLKIIF